jgi:pimeloyl-[acyl-carrier protein] methyl ester esterase
LKSQWLHHKGSEQLILFCNGWGMDAIPLSPLVSHEWDVLMFCNYVDLVPDIDLDSLLNAHKNIILISWSMGVWAGQRIFAGYQDKLKGSLAINGTLCPIHDQFGIPEKVVRATLAQFDEKGRLKFYQRMCRDRGLYRRFLDQQPQRSLADQKRELAHLLKVVYCDLEEKPIYDRALVAGHDFIMPTANQLEYWPKKKVRRVDGYHFLFYKYQSWDELVREVESRKGRKSERRCMV